MTELTRTQSPWPCPYCPYVDNRGKVHDPLTTEREKLIHSITHRHQPNTINEDDKVCE